jgi:hypothetical protein
MTDQDKQTERVTLAQFIERHGIVMTAERTQRNPNMDDSKWEADHWLCTIRCGKRKLDTYFSQGIGHRAKPLPSWQGKGRPIAPKLDAVLDCLAMDASTIENSRDFEEFARELGYDTDSRKAERAYDACKRQARDLERLLGREAYNQLLWEVERL